MAASTSKTVSNVGTGAATGASVGGPWGAVIGGAAGLVMSAFEDDPAEQRAAAMRNYQTAMNNAQNEYMTSQQQVLDPYASMYTTEGVKGSLQGYTSALEGANPEQYKVNVGDYQQQNIDALGTWKDYLDPSIEYQQESARKNIEESAAGQGGLYSGAAAREIAADTAKIAEQGYQDAYDRARQSGLDVNAVTQQNLLNQMQGGNYNVGLTQTNIGNLGTSYDTQREVMDTYSSGVADLNKTRLANQQSIAQTNLGASIGETGGSSTWDSLIGGVGQAQQSGMFNKGFWNFGGSGSQAGGK